MELIKFITSYKDAMDIIIKFCTVILTGIGCFITILKGINSFRNYNDLKKREYISKCLMLFSEENSVKRLSGLNGLIKNNRTIFDEMFFLIGREKDYFIKEMMVDSLKEICQLTLEKNIKYNSFFSSCYLRIISEIESIKLFEDKGIAFLQEENSDVWVDIQLVSKFKPNINAIILNDKYLTEYIMLSSKLLSKGLNYKKKKKLNKSIVVFSNTQNYKWRAHYFQACIFSKNVMKKMKLNKNHFCDVFMEKNDFSESIFNKCKFINNDINGSWFNQCIFIKSICNEVNIFGTEFKKVSFKDFQVKGNLSNNTFNGSKFHNSVFKESTITKCTIEGTKFKECRFEGCQIWKNKIKGNFVNCEFSNVKLGGTIFQDSTFENCTFRDVKFDGSTLKDVEFINCKFDEKSDYLLAHGGNNIIS